MNEHEQELLDQCTRRLSEEFDCVQVVASKLNPDGSTTSYHWGSGNWFARKALCEEFIEVNNARVIAKEINSSKNT